MIGPNSEWCIYRPKLNHQTPFHHMYEQGSGDKCLDQMWFIGGLHAYLSYVQVQ